MAQVELKRDGDVVLVAEQIIRRGGRVEHGPLTIYSGDVEVWSGEDTPVQAAELAAEWEKAVGGAKPKKKTYPKKASN